MVSGFYVPNSQSILTPTLLLTTTLLPRHTRYYEAPLPNFSEPAKKTSRKRKRVPRREQPAPFAPRGAAIPVRGSLSVRPQFHNLPLELPPLPTGPVHMSEHSIRSVVEILVYLHNIITSEF